MEKSKELFLIPVEIWFLVMLLLVNILFAMTIRLVLMWKKRGKQKDLKISNEVNWKLSDSVDKWLKEKNSPERV